MRTFLMVLIGSVCALGRLAADSAPAIPVEAVTVDSRLDSLKSVIEPLTSSSAELEKLKKELKQSASDEGRQEIQIRIDAERERIRQLRKNFRDIIGGAEAAEYDGQATEELSLQNQVTELIQPALSELRQASSLPRELELLRKSLANWEGRKNKSQIIIERIEKLEEQVKDPLLVAEFQTARKFWEGSQAEAVGQIGVIQSQIVERESKHKPVWEVFSEMFSHFFRNRGLNLLLALLTAAAGFVLTRRIYSSLRRYSPVHRHGKASLMSRVSDILAIAIAIMVSVLGVLTVFYVRGDWLLLTLVVVLLIGAVWAGKQSLPPYIEQIRMLLNLGSVREGERVVYMGLPWKVQSIGFFTTLCNPNLQGGDIRIPIRSLMAMISRDADPKEPWFPTEVDQWVILNDGTYGKVVTQSPEQVVVLLLGGSLKTYQTTEFLSLSPENLSCGFRVACVFGIDYTHQADATTTVPEIMHDALTSVLIGDYGREKIRSIKVEFLKAGSSSLDYQIQVDVSGEMAARHPFLGRLIQKVCLDVCNQNGWIIPFTQITVHQAVDLQS